MSPTTSQIHSRIRTMGNTGMVFKSTAEEIDCYIYHIEEKNKALEKERDELRATVHTLQSMLKEAQRG